MDEMFTDTEILLAADRFIAEKTPNGLAICLSDDFMKPGVDLSTIREVLRIVRFSLEKGHKVFINEVNNGYERIQQRAST